MHGMHRVRSRIGKLNRVVRGGKDGNPALNKQFPILSETMSDVNKLEAKLVSVVGKKTVVGIWLQGVECEALWDTGSMISLMNTKLFEEKFPKIKVHAIEEFLGKGLKLSAANQTELKIEGVVVIILGYNVIENVVANFDSEVNPKVFFKKIAKVTDQKIVGMTNQMRANFDRADEIGEVRVLKDQILPAWTVQRVKCQTKAKINCEQTVLFSPREEIERFDEIKGVETPETLKKGPKQNFYVSLRNPSKKGVMMKKGTLVGSVLEIMQVIPMPAGEEMEFEVPSGSPRGPRNI